MGEQPQRLLRIVEGILSVAAFLKGWQLLTDPVAGNDMWSYRLFLIFQVEFEFALAIWLLPGLFKKAAWLAGIPFGSDCQMTALMYLDSEHQPFSGSCSRQVDCLVPSIVREICLMSVLKTCALRRSREVLAPGSP
ncbi:MAG: hypothetical protein ACYTBJ_07810 [Planctomycetota bacterium]